MSNDTKRLDGVLPETSINGYFTTRMLSGDRPKHNYPPNHLPIVDAGSKMAVVTGFVAAQKAEK